MFEQPADFRAESQALHDLLAPLPDADYERPTRFKGWTIGEVITHLHMWNVAAGMSLADEAAFVEFRSGLARQMETVPGETLRSFENRWVAPLAGKALLDAWRTQFERLAEQFSQADPKKRLKWGGPDMSARSSITARLMETWSHGQAVYDLLGVERRDADRIRNIVVIGINTFGWTFKVHGQELPPVLPHLRLTAPSGDLWTFNEPSATDLIEGSATEFCQVVTQTRNVADTRLKVVGESARRWMAIAQCFAGPPQLPPAPGTRFRETTGAR